LSLKNVLTYLNNLKKIGLIQDYAIGGGYAALYHEVSLSTYDLDVLVTLPSEADHHKLWEHFRVKGARIENLYIFIEDMPVQFLPNYISPLFNSAIEDALVIDFEGVRSKFVTKEYLIVLLLTAFRHKDKIRVGKLLKTADKDSALDIIRRFDNDQDKLYEKYRQVLAGT